MDPSSTDHAIEPGDTDTFDSSVPNCQSTSNDADSTDKPTAAELEVLASFDRYLLEAVEGTTAPEDTELAQTPLTSFLSGTSVDTDTDSSFRPFTGSSSMSAMTDSHSSSNSPTDFAFAAPSLSNGHGNGNDSNGDGLSGMKSFSTNMSPPSLPSFTGYHHNPFHFADGSSFSSTGSATGSSFSSADALPAISRDFAPPSTSDTRRPATAGGALAGRPAFNAGLEPAIPEENENGMQQQDVNAMNAAAARRASESQVPWHNFNNVQFSGMQMLQQQQQQQQQQPFNRAALAQARPQTSDGVPMQSFGPSLPSASTLTSQFEYRLPYARGPDLSHTTFPGDRSYSMSNGVRPSYITPPTSSSGNPMGTTVAEDGSLQFVSLGGPASKKRPRRRFDEIERLYLCGWNGCEKSYGTLNHLNAHVAMQKHGEKRLPTEFKEMRKQWRKKKREQTAAAANSQSMQMQNWARTSMSSSSGSEFDRRESSISLVPTDYSGRNSSVYSTSAYGFNDSRPGTAGSMASTDSRPGTGYSATGAAGPSMAAPAWGYGPAAAGARRVSAPTHIPMPPTIPENGFRPVEGDHPTPTPQNPFPLAVAPQQQMNGRQYFQQQTLLPPNQHTQQQQQQISGFDQFAFR